MSKINILVINQDTMGGVGFYRCIQPHKLLEEQYPDKFKVTFETDPNFSNLEEYSMFDIIFFHKGLYNDDAGFVRLLNYCKEHNIPTVMDLDDHWKLGMHHPQFVAKMQSPTEDVVKRNFKLADYVTTTTDIFAKEIKVFNQNTIVFPNAINPEDEKFVVHKEPCDKLRIGMIMGSTHEYDMMTMDGFVNKLPQDVLDKVVFVLCGFDTRGSIRMMNPQTGEVQTRPIKPEESVWYRYEKMITDNYRIISPEYRNFLEQFVPNSEYPNAYAEGYKRCWTMDMDHYYQHYSQCDVLFAPLEENDFNRVKSELKPIECCFSHTAFVGTNFGPYTIGLKNVIEKGGGINPDGNAILIDNKRAHKDWAKTVERLVKHPELVKQLQDNLYRDFHEKYDLRNVVKARADFYEKILNDRK